ncbi:MAG TPA: tail fiber domain-containing protein [Candidatus Saccharimonadales bacterium]|nr:tail fiber domain-containing protein [Candidatus Saccharimonadales bacterium]
MKTKFSFVGLLLLGLWAAPLLERRGQAANSLLPFQGRLTDASGQPVADGARVVQFKIYDAPVGGRALWNGEVQKLSVNAGLVSTVLGTKADLSVVDFNRQIYLELTIDADGDGSITPADPPLLPRQSILPAVFSVESADSRLLGGYDWSALFGTNNPADGSLLDSKIADGSLSSSKLHDGAVTSAKIADGAVTPPKLDTTGALAGQALTFDGTQVVWSQVNASNAMIASLAANSSYLKGYDWSSIFNNGNPETDTMSVAHLGVRGSAWTTDLTVYGRSIFSGPSTTVLGNLLAPSIGLNMSMNDWAIYFRAPGDYNHYLRWGNSIGNQTGFDGPMLVGLGGGILGGGSNWSLRWNSSGTVQIRGTIFSGSDRNLKENFKSVDIDAVLDKVVSMPITRWNYKSEPEADHIGPVAQDFHAAFGLGLDDKSIAMVDGDGVALAAIQGLNKKFERSSEEIMSVVKQQQEQIEALKAEIAALHNR